MITSTDALQDLTRERPEWSPWLAVVGVALDAITDEHWEAITLHTNDKRQHGAPLLAYATAVLPPSPVERLVDSLMLKAVTSGTAEMASLAHVSGRSVDPFALLAAAINRDRARLTEYAAATGAEPSAFAAVAMLAAMPVLHACNRRLPTAARENWSHGYCPVCAGWPAFAEVRGIDRSRYFRCGDCGGEWQTRCLQCAFCGTTDHERLGSLVAEKHGNGSTDICNACGGYVKVFTTLRGALPGEVVLRDLATAELDIAAVAHGYTRPAAYAFALALEIIEHDE